MSYRSLHDVRRFHTTCTTNTANATGQKFLFVVPLNPLSRFVKQKEILRNLMVPAIVKTSPETCAGEKLFADFLNIQCFPGDSSCYPYFLSDVVGNFFGVIDGVNLVANYENRSITIFNALFGTSGMPVIIPFCATMRIADVSCPGAFISSISNDSEKQYRQ